MIGKNHSFDSMTFVSKVMSLLFNMLSFGAFPGGASGKESTCQYRRHGSDSWVGKIPPEKEMAAHSSILAWEIPWTEKPGLP